MGSPEAATTGGVEVPGYDVAERLGVGGFGEVYAARHQLIGRDAAIKVLHAKYSADPDAVARFVAEARAVSQISHPNIVEIFDFGQLDDGRQYCVMERIHGTTLRDVLRERTRLPLAEGLPILRGIAEAIDAAHAAGIAHRDLKPDNVFVTDAGRIKLIDFGLAKLTRDDPASTPVTRTGSLFGTPLYMSPEQCRGKGIDTRTDLYSFGVLAYHVLTGELPFSGDALELALHHLNDEPQPPSRLCGEVTARVDRVVLALLAKDPAHRPAPLVAAVDAIDGGPSISLVRRPRRRLRWLIAGAATIALAGVGGVAFMSSRSSPAAAPRDETCVPASERLAGLWTVPQRQAIALRFAAVGRKDATATWDVIDRNMTAYLTAWATRWDAACKSPDRSHDPLLYAQRLTCLDNSLDAARGEMEALPPADPSQHSSTFEGAPVRASSLVDCDSVGMLRAQLPTPPPEQRAEIQRITAELKSLYAQTAAAVDQGEKPAEVDRLDKRHAEIIAKLDALGSPLATTAAHQRALLLSGAAFTNPARVPAAREAFDDVTRRAEATRSDLILVEALGRRIFMEVLADGPPAVIEDALRRGEMALTRLGHPPGPTAALAVERARYKAVSGHIDEAIDILRPAVAPFEEMIPLATTFSPRPLLLELWIASHRYAEAMREAEAVRDLETREYGPVHYRTAVVQWGVASTAARVGDLERAVRECDGALAILAQLDHSQPAIREFAQGIRYVKLLYALRLGAPERIASLAAALGNEASDVWGPRADQARVVGALELIPYVITQKLVPEPQRDELRRWFDFATGVPGATPPQGDDVARLEALGASGHWREVRAELETSNKIALPPPLEAHGQALLGIARVELGDETAAIPSLERALYLLGACCQDFHYFAPPARFALARALWDTGGDKKRAHYLAEQARDDYGRLGTHREADRQRVIHWLAEHPSP